MSTWSRLRALDPVRAAPPPYDAAWGPVYAVVPEFRRPVAVVAAAALVALAVSAVTAPLTALVTLAGVAATLGLGVVVRRSPRQQLRVRAVAGPVVVDGCWVHRRRAVAVVVGLGGGCVALLVLSSASGVPLRTLPFILCANAVGQLRHLGLLGRLERATGGRVVCLQRRPSRRHGGYYLLDARPAAASPAAVAAPAAGTRPASPYGRIAS